MSLARRQRQYLGVRALLPPDLQYAKRNPTSTDIAYVKGTLWLNTVSAAAFMYSGSSGVWIALGSGTSGGVVTINSLTPSAGNITLAGTANQITETSSGSTVTFSIPSTFIAPGSIAATTTLTATLGAITATNGNVVLGTAGNKIIVATGSNASAGTSAAMSGSPGAVTVSTTASSTTALIFYSRHTTGGTPGEVSITAQSGSGFTLTSTGNETSTFNWWIINA